MSSSNLTVLILITLTTECVSLFIENKYERKQLLQFLQITMIGKRVLEIDE